jgi:hypothetical protein
LITDPFHSPHFDGAQMNRIFPAPRFAPKSLGLAVTTGLLMAAASTSVLAQEKVLRIAMTAADIPRTLGQPDQGFEGNRFTGIPMYDALTHWDLSKADAASVLIPGLALSWATDAADKTKWVFKLRPGVKFHDGSDFTADAVVWNVQKVLDKDALHYAPDQIGLTVSRMPTLRTAKAIDGLTVELTTSEPDSFLPLNLTNLFMASPAHWQKKYDALGSVADKVERAKHLRPTLRDPALSRCRSSQRVSASSTSLTRTIGTRPAGPRSTASCCCRCQRPALGRRHCFPARSTGSRPLRPTRSRA